MNTIRKPPHDYTVEELDRELMIRVAQDPKKNPFVNESNIENPAQKKIMAQVKKMYEEAKSMIPNEELSHLDIEDLTLMIRVKTMKRVPDKIRGSWYEDNRMDVHLIQGDQGDRIQENCRSVVSVCFKRALVETPQRDYLLEVDNYAKENNLSLNEPFRNQPALKGRLGTGFLVKNNIVATAGHCVKGKKIDELRFVFGYRMKDSETAETLLPKRNVYKGKRVIAMELNRDTDKSDWALVELDREVFGRPVVKLSREEMALEQSIYVLGHPMGLPMKYGPGVTVKTISGAYFSAQLDIYSGNSGSPVFDGKTHEVVGIVVRGDGKDFRWTGKDWMTVIYTSEEFKSKEPECTRVSEFIDSIPQTGR